LVEDFSTMVMIAAKNYIEIGSKVKYLYITRVTICKETLKEIMGNNLVNFEGNEYLVFEVAALKEADSYGKTHPAYISKKVA
jgi:hypothetical protein